MPTSDDFYRSERQRQREPLSVNTSTTPRPLDKNGEQENTLEVPRRRNSMHLPQATVQHRRPSMPQGSVTNVHAGNVPDPAGLPQATATSAAVLASLVNIDTSGQPANIEKAIEKAADPLRRPDRQPPLIQSSATFPLGTASPSSNDASRRNERIGTLSRVASGTASPVPSDDIEMADVSGPTSGDELTQALIQFGVNAAAAGIQRFSKSQTREELDEATKEHHKARESFKNYPPLLEQAELKRKAAEHNYKTVSKKTLQFSHSRDSKAEDLATIIRSQLAQEFVQIPKVTDEPNAWRAELQPWSQKVEKLQENVQFLSSSKADGGTLVSLKERLDQLESHEPTQLTQSIHAETEKLWQENRKASQCLQRDIQHLQEREGQTTTNLAKWQEESVKATRFLEEDVSSLQKHVQNNKCDVGNLRKDYQRVIQLTKDDNRELFKRDGDKVTELKKLHQDTADLWARLTALREQSATQPDVEVIKRELKIYRDDRTPRSEFERLRKVVEELENKQSSSGNTSVQPHNSNLSPDACGLAEAALPSSTPTVVTQSEFKAALERISHLEEEVSALNKSKAEPVIQEKPEDPCAESVLFTECVDRYQRDMAEVNAKVSVIEQVKAESSQQLEDYKTATFDQILEVNSRINSIESRISAQQAVIALLPRNLVGSSSGPEPPHNTPQAGSPVSRIETELRSATSSHTQQIAQMQAQISLLAQRSHNAQTPSQGGISPVWTQSTEQMIKELQNNIGRLTYELTNTQKVASASEHSITALTIRYNNLSSEQFAKRMANHLYALPATLQVEQHSMKARLESLQVQNEELSKTVDSIRAGNVQSAAEGSSRQDFEQRLKTQYYDVLEERTQSRGEEIESKLEELNAFQNASKSFCEGLENRMNELEANTLLNAFQQPAKMKPSPPPELSIRGRSERSVSQATSQRSLADRIEHPNVFGNGKSKRPSYDGFEESITARAPSSPRKRAKWAK